MYERVQVGSRWEDRDRREVGRLLEVISYAAGTNPVVRLKTVASFTQGHRRDTTMRADNLLRRFREVPVGGAA